MPIANALTKAYNNLHHTFFKINFLQKIAFILTFVFSSWAVTFFIFSPDIILSFAVNNSFVKFAKHALQNSLNGVNIWHTISYIYSALSVFGIWFLISINLELFTTSKCYNYKLKHSIAKSLNLLTVFIISIGILLLSYSTLFIIYYFANFILSKFGIKFISTLNALSWLAWVCMFFYYFVLSFLWEIFLPIYLKSNNTIYSIRRGLSIIHKKFFEFCMLTIAKLAITSFAIYFSFKILNYFIYDFSVFGLNYYTFPISKYQMLFNGYVSVINLFIPVLIFAPFAGFVYVYFKFLFKQFFYKHLKG